MNRAVAPKRLAAVHPAINELSDGRANVGGGRVPNFLVGESEVNGGMYVGLEAQKKSLEKSVRAISG